MEPGDTAYRNPGDCQNCGDETLVILDDTTDGEWLCKLCYLGGRKDVGDRTVYRATMNGET